jgi:hypothetical protein
MLPIKDFLQRSKAHIDLSEKIRLEIGAALYEVLEIKISPDKISLIGKKIKLKLTPLERLHLKLHKEKLLARLQTIPELKGAVSDIY